MSRILLIDDEESSRLLYRNRLEDLGHQVVVASTGAVGMMEARAHEFDLFLVDVALGSGISGFEVCKRLKGIPKTRRIPAILISGQVRGREDLSRGYEAGCDAFLLKGDLNILEDVVRAHLRMKAHTDELTQQNALLEQQVRRLSERTESDAPATEGSELRPIGSPDGTLIAGRDGVVVASDAGARALFGRQLVGRHLATLAPKSRLEAIVRDTETAIHQGARFDARIDGGWGVRRLLATVVPTAPSKSTRNEAWRVVLLYDADRYSHDAGQPANDEGWIHPSEQGELIEAARRSWNAGSIIGAGPRMQEVRHQVAGFTRHNAPILIQGAEGAGSDFVARCVHYGTPWAGRLMSLQLGSLSETQMHDEIFGTIRLGVEMPGVLTKARGGTVILDGLEELPFDAQEVLSEALETRSFVPGKGQNRVGLEARVVGAISADPHVLVERGVLSERLLSAFGPSRVTLPELRDRSEDIPELARHFARLASRDDEGNLAVPQFTSEVLWSLMRHDWPRNVRELREVVTTIVQETDSETIGVEHLPLWLRELADGAPQELVEATVPYSIPTMAQASEPDWELSFEAYEKQVILRALRQTNGDRLEAAKLLNCGKSTLYRKLKKHDIE